MHSPYRVPGGRAARVHALQGATFILLLLSCYFYPGGASMKADVKSKVLLSRRR